MNGVDKGLVLLQNQPLIAHVIARLKPQVDEILINANREIAQYRAFNLPVLKDETDEFLGPLAGFSLGLQLAKHDYVLSVPCDSPLLPLDLAERLYKDMATNQADIAVARSSNDVHPVFCLIKKSLLPSLTEFLASGGRKVSAWQKSQKYIEVDFSDRILKNGVDAFVNLNSFEDLATLESALSH